VIEFHDVHKTYRVAGREIPALQPTRLNIQAGQIFGLIGHSGAGKSTLLRLINRLEEPSGGRILVEGEDVTALDAEGLRRFRQRVGMIFQHFNLVTRSSVLTNVLSGRLGYVNPLWSLVNHFSKEDIDKAMSNLERVGIADKAHNRADELSGGQQQRVGIARALMQDPRILLADEPVASLDPVLAHSIMKILKRLNQEDGITVICSLHFLDLVQQYADRAIALNEGQLVFDGLPHEIDDQRFREIYGQDAERIG